MPTDSNDGVGDAIFIDTAYAGGGANGGAPDALDENTLTQGTDTLVALDELISANFPKLMPLKKRDKDITGTIYIAKSKVTQIPPLQGQRLSYLQTDDLFDIAISGAYSAIPTTFTWPNDNAINQKDAFGCWIDQLILHGKTGDPGFTFQDAKISCRNTAVGTITMIGFNSSALATFGNIDKTNTVIDAITAASLVINEIKLTIQNEIKQDDQVYGVGDPKIQRPSLLGRVVMVEIWCIDRASNTWRADIENTTTQLIDATIVWSDFLTVTMTNLEPIDHAENIVKNGMTQHYYKFESGVGFTIA
jgi:hypothetical protein